MSRVAVAGVLFTLQLVPMHGLNRPIRSWISTFGTNPGMLAKLASRAMANLAEIISKLWEIQEKLICKKCLFSHITCCTTWKNSKRMKMPSWRWCPAGFERTKSWPNTRCAKENPITQHSLSSCLGAGIRRTACLGAGTFPGKKMRSRRPKRKTYQNLGLWQSPSRRPGRPATLPTVVWSPERLGFEGNGVTVSMELTMAGLFGLPSHSTKFPQNKLLDSQRLCLAAVKNSS